MKKRIFIVSLLSLVLILGSCQKIKDIFTVKVDADFSVNLPVTTSPSPLKSTMESFMSTNTFDPLNDADLALYQDKIKGFEVTGMTGTISNLSANVTLTDARLLVATASNTTEWNFTNLALTNGTVITFDNSAGQWAKIDTILGEQKVITVTFSGNASQTDVTFNLVVNFTTKVSVSL